jgi:hypothetical protein
MVRDAVDPFERLNLRHMWIVGRVMPSPRLHQVTHCSYLTPSPLEGPHIGIHLSHIQHNGGVHLPYLFCLVAYSVFTRPRYLTSPSLPRS